MRLYRRLHHSPPSAIIAAALLAIASINCSALPQGAQINSGSADFSHPNSQTLSIHQHSQQLSTNFQQFNIGRHETVNFIQPSHSSIALNRVVDGSASQIMGSLNANGQIFLINPQGVVFSQSAQVNVGGLLATTFDINEQDFANQDFRFFANGHHSSIINDGQLSSHDGGSIALAAPVIINNGNINAERGRVHLQSADGILLEFNNGEIAIAADKSAWLGLIENHGDISAEGGIVTLDASTHSSLHLTVINNDGVIRATSLDENHGEIILTADRGDIFNSGELNTNATDNQRGGSIKLYGDRIAQRGLITANGAGRGDGGDITVFSQSELFITQKAVTHANSGNIGDGGKIIYFSEGKTLFDGGASIAARGGSLSGNGGFVEVSGQQWVGIEGFVDTSATNGEVGTYLIDPTDITIVSGVADLNGAFDVGGSWISDAGATSQIGADTINGQFATSNVVIDSSDAGGGLGDITVNAAIDLDGATGRSLTLLAFRNLNINANICEGGAVCSAVNDSVALVLDTQTHGNSGSIIINTGVQINAGGGRIDILSDFGITIGTAAIIDSGGGDIALVSSSDTLIGDTVAFNSAGGNMLFNTFSGDFDTHNGAGTGADFDAGGGTLSITSSNNIGSAIDLNESTFSNVTDLTLRASAGGLLIPDAGLSVTGVLDISGVNIGDVSGFDLTLNAADLILKATLQNTDTTLNSNVNRIDLALANANVTINESNTLQVLDLDADTFSATVNNGNLSINVISGDLLIADTVTASDTNSDGIRSGLIDMAINQGNFTLGNTSATIESTNTVDENASGGLGSVPSNQVAIRIHYSGNDDSNRNFTLGDAVANDTVINAVGGDILIDAVGGATLTGSNRRSVILNSDVSISSLNAVAGTDGIVDLQNNSNIGPASLLAGTGRNITIIGFEALAPIVPPIIPPVVPPVTPPIQPPITTPEPVRDSINSAILAGQDTAAQVSVSTNHKVAGSPSMTNVNSLFSSVFNTEACASVDQRGKGRTHCAVNQAIQQFLGSLMIGGEILK